MKLLIYLILTCLFGGLFGLVMASTWQSYNNSKPDAILKDIVDHENSDIIKTKLDGTENNKRFDQGDSRNKLSGTLDNVRENISYYLQWIAYLALAGAVMLIVYNGLVLVISPLTPEAASKVKSRMLYIAGGIVLVTGFYFILKILLAIYYDVFVS